ncbi:hypothetical protein ACF046_00970 [Glutamicibacter creatinolyticus]|uniref:hypothetical protein n=2 Tax=Glutamicibacter creatinolyticus TaxID=162496 RepID=UPI0033C1962B
MEDLIVAFIEDAKTLSEEQLTDYKRGWQGQLPMALLDAVYSQRTQYLTKNKKGLLPRLQEFKATYEDAAVDLRALLEVSEEEIQGVVGYGVTAGRSKASAVRDVARNLVDLESPVFTANEYCHYDAEHIRAYRSVRGLGKVTHNYLGMLLGYPNTKPDTWIIAAVQRVALAANVDVVVDSGLARQVVLEAYKRDQRGETVTHYDHAIWLRERSLHESGALLIHDAAVTR